LAFLPCAGRIPPRNAVAALQSHQEEARADPLAARLWRHDRKLSSQSLGKFNFHSFAAIGLALYLG
jgi:hypothetical protein